MLAQYSFLVIGAVSLYSIGVVSLYSVGAVCLYSIGAVSLYSIGAVSLYSIGAVSLYSIGVVSLCSKQRAFWAGPGHGHGRSMAMDGPEGAPFTICANGSFKKERAQTISPRGAKKKESSSNALNDIKKTKR